MKNETNKYDDFAEHQWYGKRPLFTDLKPKMTTADQFALPTRCGGNKRVEGTAVAADMSKQSKRSYSVKYYMDEIHQCVDCRRQFIFFAREQKYWFEELQMPIEVIGRRCFECRSADKNSKKQMKRYAALKHLDDPSLEEVKFMATFCLSQLEAEVFHQKQIQTLRAYLNKLKKMNDDDGETVSFVAGLRVRLHCFEELSATKLLDKQKDEASRKALHSWQCY